MLDAKNFITVYLCTSESRKKFQSFKCFMLSTHLIFLYLYFSWAFFNKIVFLVSFLNFLYLLILLLVGLYQSLLKDKKNWESLRESEVKRNLHDSGPYTWSRGLYLFKVFFLSDFSTWLRDFLLLITSPSRSLVFLILVFLNTVMFAFKLILVIFIWYPYWVTKLFNYMFSKNILEFKLNPSDKWDNKYIFLGWQSHELVTIKQYYYCWFTVKTNAHAHYKPYFIIHCLIDKLLFIKCNSGFVTKFILFLLLLIFSFARILLVELCLLVVHPVSLSFREVKQVGISNIIYRDKHFKYPQDWRRNSTDFIFQTTLNYGRSIRKPYSNKHGICKTKDKLFSLILTEADREL